METEDVLSKLRDVRDEHLRLQDHSKLLAKRLTESEKRISELLE